MDKSPSVQHLTSYTQSTQQVCVNTLSLSTLFGDLLYIKFGNQNNKVILMIHVYCKQDHVHVYKICY